MPIPKEAGTLGMPWEQSYGYAQAVRVGDTIWVSGQLSHDNEGNIVGPAPVDRTRPAPKRRRKTDASERPVSRRATERPIRYCDARGDPPRIVHRFAHGRAELDEVLR